MSAMGFNEHEAVAAFNNALINDDELRDAMDKASKKVSDSFGAASSVVKGELGSLIEKVWGDGSDSYFRNVLAKQTELFLLYKVKSIIREQGAFVNETSNVYSNVNNSNN